MTGRLREIFAKAWEGFKGPKGSGNPLKAATDTFTEAVRTVEKPIVAADDWLKLKSEAQDLSNEELPPPPKD